MSCDPTEAAVLCGPAAAERIRQLGAAMRAHVTAPSPATRTDVTEAAGQIAPHPDVGEAALALAEQIRGGR